MLEKEAKRLRELEVELGKANKEKDLLKYANIKHNNIIHMLAYNTIQ